MAETLIYTQDQQFKMVVQYLPILFFTGATALVANLTVLAVNGSWFGLVWFIGFYPQGLRKGIFGNSKAQVTPPTHSLSYQEDPLVVRLGSQTKAACMEDEKPNHSPTDLKEIC